MGAFIIFTMMQKGKHIIESAIDELIFKTSRSSGAGGQHVNKVETKVTLRWNVRESLALSESEKELIANRLSNYINKEGELIIHDESTRSQLKNKERVIAKWKGLISRAFFEKRKRKATRVPRSVMENRRKTKKKRAEIKANRRKPRLDE